MELGKLAIDYSDGVIGTSDKAQADLINYAKTHDKQLLEKLLGKKVETHDLGRFAGALGAALMGK